MQSDKKNVLERQVIEKREMNDFETSPRSYLKDVFFSLEIGKFI